MVIGARLRPEAGAVSFSKYEIFFSRASGRYSLRRIIGNLGGYRRLPERPEIVFFYASRPGRGPGASRGWQPA